MTSKKRIILIFITLFLVSLLISCNSNSMDNIYNDNKKISNDYDTFTLNQSQERVTSGKYRGNFKLSGSKTIWTYNSDSDDNLRVPYKLAVKNGKAKIVLISGDNTVVNLIENTSKATLNGTTLLNIPIKKGLNRIKIVGYKQADIDMELHIEKGSFKE